MIKVFYFIAQMNHWESVVKDQVAAIQKSGLYDAAHSISVCVAGDQEVSLPEKYKIIKRSKIDEFEYPALQMICEGVSDGDHVCYIHTKGVSRAEPSRKLSGDRWRNYLMWGCVENWRKHTKALATHDVSSVQWTRLEKGYRKQCDAVNVFAGNFWWARGSHILRLRIPEINKRNRYLAESWVTREPDTKINDFHNLTNGRAARLKALFSSQQFGRRSYANDNDGIRRVIYTVLIGGYESLKPAPKFRGWDTIAFVDNMGITPHGWTLRHLPVTYDMGKVRTSRLPRILPYKYLPEYDESIYMDASICIHTAPERFIPENSIWAAARHWERDTVWQEFDANRIAKKVHMETANNQESDYIARGLKEKHIPLMQNCLIFRKHNLPEVITTCDAWWNNFIRGTARDQLSFPMAAATTGITISEITPRPATSRGIHWRITHDGTHRRAYRGFDLNFIIFNYRGSAISRGIQVGRCLYNRGVRNDVVTPSAIESGLKGATVIVVKELDKRYFQMMFRQKNTIIYDVVDNQKVWRKGLGDCAKYIAGVIFPTRGLMEEWLARGLLHGKHAAVIDHHGDTRFMPNHADGFNAVCISSHNQIPTEVFDSGIDVIDERHSWEGLFENALKYNMHVGVFPDNIDYTHKPPSKLVTAAACDANIILQRTPANIELLPAYPYYVDSVKEIPAMLKQAAQDFKTGQPWHDALELIRSVKCRTSGDCIAGQYEEFLDRMKRAGRKGGVIFDCHE